MYLVEIENLNITNCENLTFTLMCQNLKSLILYNCGPVHLCELPLACIVHINNASLLPDVSSGDVSNKEEPAALLVRNHIQEMMNSAYMISRCISKFLTRNRYLNYMKFKKKYNVYDCPICQEHIPIHYFTITPCDHVFHSNCLHEWLKIKRTCPLCNKNQ